MAEISPEDLIPLVKERTVLWDRFSEKFKDKVLRQAAWKEICCVLNPEFSTLGDQDQHDYVKSVTTKWIHIRDAFLRSYKKENKRVRPGKVVRKTRPYLYKTLLSFLIQTYEFPRSRQDSSNDRVSISSGSSSESEPPQKPLVPPPKKKRKTEKTTEPETLEEKISRFLDTKLNSQENRHISFMKGILPAIESFDDDDVLEFQTGMLALIQNIRSKRHYDRQTEYEVKLFHS